jgi:predicted CopG family antitoxin
MVTISISAEAYRAITGRLPNPSKRDDRGGYALVIDRKTIDQLTAVRGVGESYSDVIIRLAEEEGGSAE